MGQKAAERRVEPKVAQTGGPVAGETPSPAMSQEPATTLLKESEKSLFYLSLSTFPTVILPWLSLPQGALANMKFLILSYLGKNEQHWEIHREPLSAEGINITSCSQVDRSFFPTNLPFL